MILIVAADSKNGIGKNGTLPWRLKGDMSFFKEVTASHDISGTLIKHGVKHCEDIKFRIGKHAVAMGRKTWDSIPPKWKPLDNRTNIIISRNYGLELPNGVVMAPHMEYLRDCMDSSSGELFIAGGSQIYDEALKLNICSYAFITRIAHDFQCDTSMPSLPDGFEGVGVSDLKLDGDIQYEFTVMKNLKFVGSNNA